MWGRGVGGGRGGEGGRWWEGGRGQDVLSDWWRAEAGNVDLEVRQAGNVDGEDGNRLG